MFCLYHKTLLIHVLNSFTLFPPVASKNTSCFSHVFVQKSVLELEWSKEVILATGKNCEIKNFYLPRVQGDHLGYLNHLMVINGPTAQLWFDLFGFVFLLTASWYLSETSDATLLICPMLSNGLLQLKICNLLTSMFYIKVHSSLVSHLDI